MLINDKENRKEQKIRVGDTMVEKSTSAKLLGIKLDSDLKWDTHFWGKGDLIPSLNRRLFMIKSVSTHIPRNKLKNIADMGYSYAPE